MVSLVLVSHSKALAEATLKLVRAMAGDEVTIALAAGAGEDGNDLGTDAMAIFNAISGSMSDDGVLVLMDMGSAVLSAEMALDFLDDDSRAKVKLCPAPFVEGAVAAGVAAKIGGKIDDVMREASASLHQKTEHMDAGEPPAEAGQAPATDMSGASKVVVRILMPNGLHARPVAKLVQLASQFASDIQIRDITNGKGPVSIKSITGIIALEALKGHEVEITARGDDQEQALAALSDAVYAGLGDPVDDSADIGPVAAQVQEQKDDAFAGKPIGVCKGVVIAPLYHPAPVRADIPDSTVADTDRECELLSSALSATASKLKKKAGEVSRSTNKSDGDIFEAQAVMLEDPQLVENSRKLIRNEKLSAPKAWSESVADTIETYRSLANENLRQRALDLQDVANMVLAELGVAVDDSLEIPSKGIIVVDDITPGQVAALNKDKVLGVICMENGQTSHSSILLRSRSIPAIVQARNFATPLESVPDGTKVAIDGSTSEIWIDPKDGLLAEIEKRQAEWLKRAETERRESAEEGMTADGVRIEVFANAGSEGDSIAAAANGAEGIGLLRTEFLFLHRDSAPGEDEQVEQLNAILRPMQGRPVIIRTLDAGGDKEIPYLDMKPEANPFLGVRAIRLTLRRPELFRTQLRAILRVAKDHDVRVMFPMISTIEELRQAKEALRGAHKSLAEDGTPHRWPIITGMMMEVPSAAVLAGDFAKEIDFASIGTNDLTQYTMAVDRGNAELQRSLAQGLDPAVTALIARICEACSQQEVSVAVCGESAADPESAAILLGLGVTELSMNPGSIPEVKYWLRRQNMAELKKQAAALIAKHR